MNMHTFTLRRPAAPRRLAAAVATVVAAGLALPSLSRASSDRGRGGAATHPKRMKPVRVSIEVPQAREDVYDFLDVMANHEPFTNHILKTWEYYGPPRGLGSGARVRTSAGGRTDHLRIEVVDAERPARITEMNIGAGGRRIATGSYELSELSGGGTLIAFTYRWVRTPTEERLAAPLVRAIMRRAYRNAMNRLAAGLAEQANDSERLRVKDGLPTSHMLTARPALPR